MLGAFLLGTVAAKNHAALSSLKTIVSQDGNWRVQEMLAKAFDQYAKDFGYESSLPEIRDWLESTNPNVVRAVVEGLRIWTSRQYFKQNPKLAIELISQQKNNPSEYVRKSVGNALRDISRKYTDFVKSETDTWDLNDPKIAFTYKLVYKR